MPNFKSDELPYDMGNTGDLIKHGLLAEYTQWWTTQYGNMVYIDPFGGRPWQEPINDEVSRRLSDLNGTALFRAQKKSISQYYGSGFVVKNSVNNIDNKVSILVSDRDENALHDLLLVGFNQFKNKSFNKKNAFSILDCHQLDQDTLILLDPFDDFINDAAIEFSRIASFIKKTNIPIALYMLSEQKSQVLFSKLRQQHFDGKFNQISISCPRLKNTVVKGEKKYASEILLILPKNKFKSTLGSLKNKLTYFTKKLSSTLKVEIILNLNA